MDINPADPASDPVARTLGQRQQAARERLSAGGNMWLASSDARGPHLIPVSFWWGGARITTSTFANSRTVTNIVARPKVRVSIGSTTDVLMIDAAASVVLDDAVDSDAAEGYAAASRIPRGTPGFVYVELLPQRIQLWRGPGEFEGCTVMRGGVWLTSPVD